MKNELISLNLKELPFKYLIPYVFVSMNNLQLGQYFKNKFSYFQTSYRKKIFMKTHNFLKSDYNYFLISSIQPSGKSYFLTDFVLRTRLEEKYSNLRVLYLNNTQIFSNDPFQYIISELIYQIFDDIDHDQIIPNFPLPPLVTFHKKRNQIINWLYFLESKQNVDSIEHLLDFFANLKLYLKSLCKKVILVWDQIDIICHSCETKENIWFNAICYSDCFDFIILCTSNINEQNYEKLFKNIDHLEMNPHQVFQAKELKSLISYEAKNNMPIDMQVQDYVSEVYNMMEGSLLEYHKFKKSRTDEKNPFVNYQNFNEIKSNFTHDKQNNNEDYSSKNYESCLRNPVLFFLPFFFKYILLIIIYF